MAKEATIQIYRGEEAEIPVLEDGEPGWCTDTHKLFIGQDGTNREVGGGGSGATPETVTENGLPLAFLLMGC